MNATFRKVEACRYEYAGTGYYVEQMANGKWDAYLPGEDHTIRQWQSVYHPTRRSAGSAIAMARRARFRQ